MNKDIQVRLEYKLISSNNIKRIFLNLEDYFDLNYIEQNEEIDIDSIPLYNHCINYLNIDVYDIDYTKIILINDIKKNTITIIESFWNLGKNRIIERIDTEQGEISYWQMIISVIIQEDPKMEEIMRFGKKNHIPKIECHSLILDNPDESQTIIDIYP